MDRISFVAKLIRSDWDTCSSNSKDNRDRLTFEGNVEITLPKTLAALVKRNRKYRITITETR